MKQSAAPRRRRPKSMASSTSPKSALQNGDQYQSKVLVRALEVLDTFEAPDSTFSLSEVGARSGLPESSLFRILVTLCSCGYLVQHESGAYTLAPKIAAGKAWERSEQVRRLAHSKLRQLVSQFQETASLAYLFDDCIRVVDSVESFHDIRMTNKIGRIVPPYASSLAKSIVAFQPPAAIDRIIDVYGVFRRTEKTLVDRHAIYAELAAVRKRGYAFDREEATQGGVCVSAPIVSPRGNVEASISVAAPLIRYNEKYERNLIVALLQVTKEISTLWAAGKR